MLKVLRYTLLLRSCVTGRKPVSSSPGCLHKLFLREIRMMTLWTYGFLFGRDQPESCSAPC
jgi:hypothetical protein